MLSVSVLTDAGFIETLNAEWEDLLCASPGATPFQTPEWVGAWCRAFLGGKSLHIIALRDEDILVGLMPMVRTRLPWRALRTIGTGVSDYLHPLSRSGYEEQVAAALWSHFQTADGVDLVDLQQLRESSPLAAALPAQVKAIPDERCYTLDLPESWNTYMASLSKSLRYEARRLEKPPFSTGEAVVRTLVEPNDIKRGLDALFDLHGKRWRKRGLPGVFALARVRRFHYDFAAAAALKGRLRLGILEQGATVFGAIYAMAVNETVFFYQSGFDPEAKALSPGSVLVAHTIREAIGSGARQFDFLRGDEPYKLRWKPQHSMCNVRLMLPRTKVLGGTGEAMNKMRGRVESRIRARLASKTQPGA